MNKWLLLLSFVCFLTSHEIKPVAWSMGEPIWKEGESLPPEGQSWIVICARTWGIFENNTMPESFLRKLLSIAGHAWIERLMSDGMLSSISTVKEPKDKFVSRNDHLNYKFDKDTIRLGFLVPDSLADQIFNTAETYANMGYNALFHNCVHTTKCGASVAALEELFEKVMYSWDETGVVPAKGMIFTPWHLYSSVAGKINELNGWDSSISIPSKGIKDQIVWLDLASDDPYFPSIFYPPSSLQLEKDYMPMVFQTRGNFGGIALSKCAEFHLNLSDIYGAVFDENTFQIILVGKKRIQLPDFKLDDLAVAIQSVYGLKGNPPMDPGVSIDPVPGDEHVVRFLGETRHTAFGKTLFDADYTLKMLAMGHYPCSVSGFSSFWDRLHNKPIAFQTSCNWRTWIVPEKISLVETLDGSGMIFEETKMRCFAETQCSNDPNVQTALEGFAAHFTSNYDQIASEYPIFSEIKRLGQITGVVKWLQSHQLPFDLSFFTNYSPILASTPDSILKVQNQSSNIVMSGGILLQLAQNNYSVEKKSDIDLFKKKVIASRPDESSLSWEVDHLSAQAVSFVKTQKNGDLRTAFIDLKIAGSSLFLTRYYDSFSDMDVGFGRGWAVTPFEVLTAAVNAPFCVIREGNEHWIYQRITGYWFLREDGKQSLFLDHDLNSIVTFEDGKKAFFNTLGQLTAIRDKLGSSINYSYEAGFLSEIQHPNGTIRLINKNGRIIQATSSEGKNVRYLYNERGLLSSICDSQKNLRIHYGYDSDLRLSSMNGPNGEVLFSGTYDDYNRLNSCRWAIGF